MKKRNIISLSGDLASGKGAVSEVLMKKLNFGIYRNGEYFRKLAKENNMSLSEFGKYVESHPEIDIEIENSAKDYALNNDNFVIDARLGWYVVPNSFKVYLKVDIDEAVKRAYNDEKRNDVEKFFSLEDCKNSLIERFSKENQRYFKLYGIKKDDMNNYDLVVDTTFLTQEQVADIIIDEYEKWKKS